MKMINDIRIMKCLKTFGVYNYFFVYPDTNKWME